MKNGHSKLILRKEDYHLLISYLNGSKMNSTFNRNDAEELRAELKKAQLVDGNDFPADVIGINSRVWVKADNKQVLELVLVTPDKADIKSGKISVMAPIGTALIGFRKGNQVKWQVPGGKKTFTILDVVNDG